MVLVLLGFLFVHFYMPRAITEIRNPVSNFFATKKIKKGISSLGLQKYDSETVYFKSFDSTKLCGRLAHSIRPKSEGTIILVHGIRSSKDQYVYMQQNLADSGYHSLAIDLRAHGESDGQYCTFGVKEKKDISAAIDFLYKTKLDVKPIGIWGQSLGGAVALQALGSEQRLKFGIIESTFCNFRSITHDYFNKLFGFDFVPFTNYLINRSGSMAGFNPEDASPLNACESIRQPVLMAHGKMDQKISMKYAYKNFKAVSHENKKLLPIDGASHSNLWHAGGQDYLDQVFKFLDNKLLN